MTLEQEKNQHYVPQFCLRKFASDSDKVINLYNLDSKKFIRNASIKHQACKDYFYSQDIAIENTFSHFEENASRIFNKILQENKLPPKTMEDYSRLLLFISVQYNRTQYARNDMLNIVDKIISLFGKDLSPRLKENFEQMSAHLKDNWIYEKLYVAIIDIIFLLDMKMKLIINKTGNDFIYSDNPVVFYNQFFEMKGRAEVGYQSAGLEIFLPISPSLCLILYDSGIYHMGKSQSDTIEVSNPEDIYNINHLQVLSAFSNIYFRKELDPKHFEGKNNYRNKSMSTVKEYQSVTNPYDGLLEIQTIPVLCNLKLSFMKLSKHAKRYNYDAKKVSHLRSESLNFFAEMIWNLVCLRNRPALAGV